MGHLFDGQQLIEWAEKMKDVVITALFAVIMLLNLLDVVTDVRLGVPAWHVMTEGIIVILSAIACIFLIVEMRARTRRLHRLSVELKRSDEALADLSSEMAQARHAYSEAIRKQFHLWQLTESEREVAMLLLKGLSFREIATLRATREKTVRQQASSIYGKSGLEGRHAFAAWFLEDAMEPGALAA
jgi:DNA-binding NarL/FixJ family response regulator